MPRLPDFLSHYYEASRGPFCSLSDLPPEEAERVMADICAAGKTFASQRNKDYLTIRRELEGQIRQKFMEKGGQPKRMRPHYMILGACPWLLSWYEQGRELLIPLAHFDPAVVSFTYGDTFPAMRYQDGKACRGQVYLLSELEALIAELGLPQLCNADGRAGPDRYIEAQVWDDEPLSPYLDAAQTTTETKL